MEFSKLSWQEKCLWIAFGIYALLVLYGVTNHEPWRDEAQSYLAARDNSISGLFTFLPSEGHPPLWYLIIMPFVKMGLPYAFQNYLAAAFAIGGVFILLFRTSVPFVVKLLVPFSYFFLYEYAVFARDYCLIVFFVSAIIALYPQRFEKPWLFAGSVACLFNTQMLMFTLAVAIALLFIIDAMQQKKLNGQVLGSFALMCVAGLYLIPFIVMKSSANIFDADITDHTQEMLVTASFGLLINDNTDVGMLLLLGLLIPLVARPKALMVAVIGLSGIMYILGYKFVGGIRHCGLLFMVMIASYAIAEYYKDDKWNIKKWTGVVQYGGWLLAGVALMQLSYTSEHYTDDIKLNYSDSKTVADIINKNTQGNAVLSAYPAAYACSIVPYLKKHTKTFYPESRRYGSFYINDSFYHKTVPEEVFIKTTLDSLRNYNGDVFLVCNYPLKKETTEDFDLLYYTKETAIFNNEMFCVYKLKKQILP
ncbi:MAG: hypothetical protein JST82_04935 [Bacteroidetes bacterium]|nr:hypothetical protein [Bacteroidota bacterium]